MRRPAASNSPTEQSLRSLMLVENDERISVLPMSSVIDSRRLLNTSMAIGSARRVMRAISISRLPERSTLSAQPGGTSVVALISSMTAGPESRVPMARPARSNTGVAIQPASKCTCARRLRLRRADGADEVRRRSLDQADRLQPAVHHLDRAARDVVAVFAAMRVGESADEIAEPHIVVRQAAPAPRGSGPCSAPRSRARSGGDRPRCVRSPARRGHLSCIAA